MAGAGAGTHRASPLIALVAAAIVLLAAGAALAVWLTS